MPCACAEETCRSGSISKSHQLTNLNKCGKFHACIQNSTILALSRLATNSVLAGNTQPCQTVQYQNYLLLGWNCTFNIGDGNLKVFSTSPVVTSHNDTVLSVAALSSFLPFLLQLYGIHTCIKHFFKNMEFTFNSLHTELVFMFCVIC